MTKGKKIEWTQEEIDRIRRVHSTIDYGKPKRTNMTNPLNRVKEWIWRMLKTEKE